MAHATRTSRNAQGILVLANFRQSEAFHKKTWGEEKVLKTKHSLVWLKWMAIDLFKRKKDGKRYSSLFAHPHLKHVFHVWQSEFSQLFAPKTPQRIFHLEPWVYLRAIKSSISIEPCGCLTMTSDQLSQFWRGHGPSSPWNMGNMVHEGWSLTRRLWPWCLVDDCFTPRWEKYKWS